MTRRVSKNRRDSRFPVVTARRYVSRLNLFCAAMMLLALTCSVFAMPARVVAEPTGLVPHSSAVQESNTTTTTTATTVPETIDPATTESAQTQSADTQSAEDEADQGEDVITTDDDSVGTYPLIVLGIGIVTVLVLIIGFKINAFIALISAAILVSLLAPGNIESKISRVAQSFGGTAGDIAIVIALAAVIGKCMLDSGAADRIVRAFLKLFGVERSPIALLGSGFVLAVPVFFDTVFYLLVPLARSLYRTTQKSYLLYLLAIAAGGAITHTLVPPTPGPLLMASNLNIDVGMMILVGALVAGPAAVAGLVFGGVANRFMPIPMRPVGNEPEPDPIPDDQLPSLWVSLLPVLLPVVLISFSTVMVTMADLEDAAALRPGQIDWPAWGEKLNAEQSRTDDNPSRLLLAHPALSQTTRQWLNSGDLTNEEAQTVALTELNQVLRDKRFYREAAFLGVPLNGFAKAKVDADNTRMKPVDTTRMNRELLEAAYPETITPHVWATPGRRRANWALFFGNANLALLISTIIAMVTLVVQRGLSRKDLALSVESALMSGGVIILITAGGAAFGGMLAQAQIGPAIQELFSGPQQAEMSGIAFLLLGFSIAAVLKVAQGSSTVAMIVGSGMIAAIVGDTPLGYHTVYIATAVGSGSLIGSWMNDSGFWIFAKMGGLTEGEALRAWTPLLIVMGVVGLLMSLLLATVLPMAGAA